VPVACSFNHSDGDISQLIVRGMMRVLISPLRLGVRDSFEHLGQFLVSTFCFVPIFVCSVPPQTFKMDQLDSCAAHTSTHRHSQAFNGTQTRSVHEQSVTDCVFKLSAHLVHPLHWRPPFPHWQRDISGADKPPLASVLLTKSRS